MALAAAAFGSELRPGSGRGICVKALKAIDEFPDDVEENVKTLTNAMARIPDKRYRRIIAYRLSLFQKAEQQEKNLEAEQAYEEAQELLEERPEDYVGNVAKLERILPRVAGTKYEDSIRDALKAQKLMAEKIGGKRDLKYKLMDDVEHVLNHPEKHYLNVEMLEEDIRKYAYLPKLIEELEVKSLLLSERAGWEAQKAEFDEELATVEELRRIQPEAYEARVRILEAMKPRVADTPYERKVERRLASERGATVSQVPTSAAGGLTGEERLLRLANDVMSSGASTSEVMADSRRAEGLARTATEKKQGMAELEAAESKAKTARELREVAATAADLPWARRKAEELYERVAADKDAKEASLARKGLGDLLARLPLEEYSAEVAAKKGQPDSWRYALDCYEKAAKGDVEMAAKEEFTLTEARLCVELSVHFKEKGNNELAGKYEGLARDDLGPLAKSADERTKNAALKLLKLLEGSK